MPEQVRHDNLNFNFINLHPFAGYRLRVKPLTADITGGIDLGYCQDARENGYAESIKDLVVTTSVSRKTISFDARPRLQLSFGYKKYGAYLGYSVGLVNYKSGYIGGVNECYSRIMRFGISYRL